MIMSAESLKYHREGCYHNGSRSFSWTDVLLEKIFFIVGRCVWDLSKRVIKVLQLRSSTILHSTWINIIKVNIIKIYTKNTHFITRNVTLPEFSSKGVYTVYHHLWIKHYEDFNHLTCNIPIRKKN